MFNIFLVVQACVYPRNDHDTCKRRNVFDNTCHDELDVHPTYFAGIDLG